MDLGSLDSLNFYQDCIDFDMKNEYDRILSNSFNYDEPISLHDDSMLSMMDPLNSGLWLNSNLDSIHHLDFMEGDLESTIMVNPNSVIPSSAEAAEIKIKEEELLKEEEPVVKEEPETDLDSTEKFLSPNEIKQEPIEESKDIIIHSPKVTLTCVQDKSPFDITKVEELKPAITKAIRLSDLLGQTSSHGHQKTELMTVRVTMPSSVSALKTTVSSRTVPVSFVNNTIGTSYKIVRPKQQIKPIQSRIISNRNNEHLGGLYPRPTYSYSCLIAMALKNSSTGSLPVSEIYNFMW